MDWGEIAMGIALSYLSTSDPAQRRMYFEDPSNAQCLADNLHCAKRTIQKFTPTAWRG